MTAAPFLGRVVTATTPTSTGTVQITSPGFGTPAGVLVVAARTVTTGGPPADAHWSACWGVGDGTEVRSETSFSENGVTTSRSRSAGSDSRILVLYDAVSTPPTIEVAAEFSQWVTDGVELDFTSVAASGYKYFVVLFGGTQCECFVGDATPDETVSLGAEVDFVLTHFLSSGFGSELRESQSRFAPGMVSAADEKNSGILGQSGDVLTTQQAGTVQFPAEVTQAVIIDSVPAFGATTYLDTFDSDGFSVGQGFPGIGGATIAYLAVKVNGAVAVGVSHDEVEDTPTSTGTQTYTLPGHRSGLLLACSANSTGSGSSTIERNAIAGFGASDMRTQACVSVLDRNNVSTTLTRSVFNERLVHLLGAGGAASLVIASVDDFDPDGFVLDWEDIDGTARKWSYISIEEMPQVVSPTGIASEEAFGTPTIHAVIEVSPAGIASEEAFGTPTIVAGSVAISPAGIASEEAFGTAVIVTGSVEISPAGIASAEAFGTPTLMQGQTISKAGGIASQEKFGIPFVRGGAIPVTLKKRIYDAICEQIQLGTFVAASYDSETCVLEQGQQVMPAGIEINELDGSYRVDDRHGLAFREDYVRWQWLAVVRFNEEVICEPFERAWLRDPPCLPRTATEDRQVRLLLLNSQYNHPPREGNSNGTEARYHFGAMLSPQ